MSGRNRKERDPDVERIRKIAMPAVYNLDGQLNPDSLRWYRRIHRLTRRQAAVLIDVSYWTWVSWENGKRQPSEKNLYGIDSIIYATSKTLEKYGGVMPPHERMSNLLEWGDDPKRPGQQYWRVIDGGKEVATEWAIRKSEIVQELEAQVQDLQRQLRECNQSLAYERRRK